MHTTINHLNLFRMAVLLELMGLVVETATLMGGASTGLGPAVGLAMILLGLVLYTASAWGVLTMEEASTTHSIPM